MGANRLDVQPVAANHRLERVVGSIALGNEQLGVAKVADARREAKAQQVHQGEDMIGEARRIGVVLLNAQVGLVVQQAIEHIGRVAQADVDYLGAEGRVLVRDMGIERPPRTASIFRVDVPGTLCFAAGSEVGVWGAEERQKQLSVCSNRYQRDHAGDAIRLWQRLPAPRTNTAPAC